MSLKNDDTLPASYKYAWDAGSDITLQDFLTKFKPSMVQNDGTKPWIWVRGSASSKESTGIEEAREEAAKLLKKVSEKVENIKNDESIPVRSSKKTGAKSKKEVREQVQAEATEQLKNIAIKHGYVCGKWLIFAPADKVDMIWSSIATSLVSGPLHSTSADLAKVSTSSEDENSRGQHLICVYLPDVYDKTQVAEVMKVLLRNHGATLSGVKSDLYTTIGIDSKHPSGIPSTIWKNAAVLSEKEAKELKDAYFAELATKSTPAVKTPAAGAPSSNEDPHAVVAKASTKPKLKKKNADPFGSEDDEAKQQPTDAAKSEAEVKKPKPKPKLKKKVNDPFGSDDEDDESKNTESKPVAAKAKRAQQGNDSEEDRPKKKRVVGK